MSLITTILGLLISVLVILYILQLFDVKKDNNIIRKESKTPESLQRAIKKTIKENQNKEPEERLRICPICGTILSKTDYLIAAFEPMDDPTKKRRVNIYGCIYCFTSDGVIKNKENIDPSQII